MLGEYVLCDFVEWSSCNAVMTEGEAVLLAVGSGAFALKWVQQERPKRVSFKSVLQ